MLKNIENLKKIVKILIIKKGNIQKFKLTKMSQFQFIKPLDTKIQFNLNKRYQNSRIEIIFSV